GRAKNKSPRSVDEILLELFRAADKAAHARQRLAARMHGDEDLIGETRRRDQSSSLRSCDADGMGFIDDELGCISFRECDEIGERGAVAIHAKNALADDEFLRCTGKILA